jgi:hypothetical protein
MGEPFAAFGDVDQLGMPSVWLAAHARAEAREAARERREADERRERGEERQQVALWQSYQRALAEGREGVDLSRPETYVLTAGELADRVFAEQDREAARADRKALVDAGLLHVLNVPADEMAAPRPDPAPDAEELADSWAGRMQARTSHAGIVARIKRGLRPKVRS